MRRLASRILVVVALFVVVVAGLLVTRSRTVPGEVASPGPAPSAADLSIQDVELREETAGGARWQLRAEQAQVFEPEGRTALRRLTVRVHHQGRTWTIVGDEGDVFPASRDFEVRRNVVLTADDGWRLETTVLRWNGAERRLWTDAPVRLSRPGSVVRGAGLVVSMDDEATTVQGPVTASFARERRS
jgi:LPS export ABC transporter protein LptC